MERKFFFVGIFLGNHKWMCIIYARFIIIERLKNWFNQIMRSNDLINIFERKRKNCISSNIIMQTHLKISLYTNAPKNRCLPKKFNFEIFSVFFHSFSRVIGFHVQSLSFFWTKFDLI